jgi:RHS repeat-associated protein
MLYDGIGRSVATANYGTNNDAGPPTWQTPPGYDDNGNMTAMPSPLDVGVELEATYDAWNRLVKTDDGTTVVEYAYDGMNRRITKTSGGTVRHFYYSDQWQVLEERLGSNATADRQYVWGQRYIDDLVLRDSTSERLYTLQDALFNVVALTDDDGDVVERFAYQAYGQSEPLNPDYTAYNGTDYQWTYRFTGRELDLETGLQLNRNRYLHLQLGRWVTRDPIGYFGGDRNLYVYSGCKPTMHKDAFGLLYPGLMEPGPNGELIPAWPITPLPPTPYDNLWNAANNNPFLWRLKHCAEKYGCISGVYCDFCRKGTNGVYRYYTGPSYYSDKIVICWSFLSRVQPESTIVEVFAEELYHALTICHQQHGYLQDNRPFPGVLSALSTANLSGKDQECAVCLANEMLAKLCARRHGAGNPQSDASTAQILNDALASCSSCTKDYSKPGYDDQKKIVVIARVLAWYGTEAATLCENIDNKCGVT